MTNAPTGPRPARTAGGRARRAAITVAAGTAALGVLAPVVATAGTGSALAASGHGARDAGHGAPRGLQAAARQLVADGQPGVIIMSRNGTRVSHVTAGVADKATGRPMDPRLHFRIASVTKSFTATVVLKLVAERKISLDDTVDKWLPGLVRANGNDGRKITVRQLLQHTSGLREYALDPRVQSEPRRDWKHEELIAMATEQPPLSEPGDEWHYSNANYILAGMIVEKATGHSFTHELKRRIIKPLKLRHTSMPATRAMPRPYAHGYFGSFGDVSTEISPSSGWTSGGMISTVDDVARFHRALFTGRLLPKAQQRQLTETRHVVDEGLEQDYGLGVTKMRLACGDAWGHDGGWPGYRTWTYTSPDGRRQAVITYNDNDQRMEQDKTFRDHLAKAAEIAFCR